VAAPLLPQLLEVLRELRAAAPLKTAPVLGLDGKPKSYEKRPYAADYVNNPVGDFMVNMPDFVVEHSAKGDMIMDGVSGRPPCPGSGGVRGACVHLSHSSSGKTASVVFCESGGAGLAEGEGGVTLIELTLDALFAAAHSKNAAKVMHTSGALGALERLFDYSTEAVIARVLRLLARLAAHCEGVAGELEASASTVALAALVRNTPPLTPHLPASGLSCERLCWSLLYTSRRSPRKHVCAIRSLSQ